MQYRSLTHAAVLATLLLAGSLAGFGQANTGIITGIITDPSGAIIPGAQVKAMNVATGLTRGAVSNATGNYVLGALPLGIYTLTVTAEGFMSSTRTGLTPTAGQSLVIDVKLSINGVKQTITVSGVPTELAFARSSAELQGNIASKQLHTLPLQAQDWTSLLTTTMKGVQNTPATGPKGVSINSMVINGMPSSSLNVTVDGTDAEADPEVSGLGSYGGFNSINIVNTADIAQITLSKGIAPPSAGIGMTGTVNIVTKSGGNQFHGSAFEYNNNSALGARNQFLTTRPFSNFNQFGFSLGGPILKDRLFFFGTYEGVRNPTFALVSGTVPTPEFTKQAVAAVPAYAYVMDSFPAPNQAYSSGAQTGFYESSGRDVKNDNNATARMDYEINNNNLLTLRVIRARPSELIPNLIPINFRTFTGKSNMYNGQYTHSANSWTSATRFGLNWMKEQRLDHGFSTETSGSSPGLDEIIFGGFDSNGAEDFNIFGTTLTFQEDVTASVGNNTIQFGGLLQHFADGRIDNTTTTFEYSTLDHFLDNAPDQIQINFPLTSFTLNRWQYGGYVQDTYRVTPRLTAIAGTRYDYWTVPTEPDGRIYSRNSTSLGPGTGSLRPSSQMYKPSWGGFGPRVGLSLSLGKNQDTVIRSGFGMFVSGVTIFGGPIDEVLDSPYVPFRLTLGSQQAKAMNLNLPVDKTAVQESLEQAEAPVATSALADHFHNPYSYQYLLDIQHQFSHGLVFDTAYVGTLGRHIEMVEATNLPARTTGVVPYPVFGSFKFYNPGNNTTYNAWQTSLNKRISDNLQFTFNYTWSRSMAYDNYGDTGQTNETTAYTDDLNSNYGPTYWDTPSYFSANVVYVPPIGRWLGVNNHILREVTNGWQLSTIVTASDGTPNDITDSSSNYPGDRPDRVNGESLALNNYSITHLQYANPAAFLAVPISSLSGAQVRQGTLSRGVLRGPGMWNDDLQVSKTFPLREGIQFNIEGSFFNLFNHTNLSDPVTNISSSNFGKLTSATSRSIQLGGRLTF
jgi:Carboxypeptidase regulatory-like domain/TonB dependent receptor-like, beta-barrel/TonB-dependent Receptor Plug Domain